MTEFQATAGLVILFGILLALSRFLQYEKQKRKDLEFLMATFAPHIAQLEQVMHLLAVSMPAATEAVNILADAMQKIGWTMEEMTTDRGLNEQPHHLKGSIRVNVIGQAEP